MSLALDPARSIALAASAGTGKTWTLTARIVRLLLAGAEPGGILALTFTRKAAAEMRERVSNRLKELAFADEAALPGLLAAIGAATDDATQRRARALFEQFLYAEVPLKATTLHAFCQDLLSRFPLEAGVPAGFTLLEEEDALRSEAIERTLTAAHRDPSGALAAALDALAAEGFGEMGLRGLLRGVFDHRSELWAATEGQDDALESLSAALAAELGWREGDDIHAAIRAPALVARLKMLFGMLQDIASVGTLKWTMLEPALDAEGAEALAALQTALFTKEGKRRAFKPSSKFTPQQKETIERLFDSVCEAVEASLEAQRAAATWRRTRAALTLGLAALGHFAEALQRAHQLGFAELEWQTVRLLTAEGHADWVRYKLDARLEHVLLDEFQDTSPTQWRLLLPLLAEFAQAPTQRTAFVVGDAKQSIYGFRRAEPALLERAGDWLVEHLAAERTQLDTSRRSAPAIIAFVNALFAGEAGQALQFAPHRTALTELHGAVEVAPLVGRAEALPAANDGALRNPLTTLRETLEDRRAAEEAQWVVDRITQLIEQRTPVTERSGRTRAMDHGDVMVLARHRTHLGALERALAAVGIPFSSATRGTLLGTALARDLVALLAVIESPHRRLDLAHALRSPLFSASDDDLLWLAGRAAAAGEDWFAALGAPDAPPALHRAQALLKRWRELALRLPPHDLIDRIASEGDLLRRARAVRPQDLQAGANLSALLQLALDTDQGRYPTLGGFLRQLAALARRRANEAPDEAPPPAGEARVRVMTVHAAKGLEAPAVFLVNAAPSPRAAQPGWRLRWPVAATRPEVIVHVGSAATRERLSTSLVAAEAQREAQEALNLLYVAVTRAQQYLFVSGFQSGTKVQDDSWHARCQAALAALAGSAVDPARWQRHAEGTPPPVTIAATPKTSPAAIDPRLLAFRPLSASEAPDRRARDAGAVLRGQTVHGILQWAVSDPTSDDAALRGRVQQQLALTLPEALWTAALAEARGVLAAPALARYLAPGPRAWNEVALHLDDAAGGIGIHVLDRLVELDDALWVLDYKTHRNTTATGVLGGAADQLARYVTAVQRLFPGRAVRAAVIWTPEARLLEVSE